MKPTVPELIDKLATEGDADQIASFLEERGVTGHTGRRDSCVVAQYLRREVPDSRASVGPTLIHWGLIGSRSSLLLPIEVSVFINRFDDGKYPELKATILGEEK